MKLISTVPTRGYAEKEGDARSFHPKLRPPVQDEELGIDQRTGMKVYIFITGYVFCFILSLEIHGNRKSRMGYLYRFHPTNFPFLH
jgi:hypothetical protein